MQARMLLQGQNRCHAHSPCPGQPHGGDPARCCEAGWAPHLEAHKTGHAFQLPHNPGNLLPPAFTQPASTPLVSAAAPFHGCLQLHSGRRAAGQEGAGGAGREQRLKWVAVGGRDLGVWGVWGGVTRSGPGCERVQGSSKGGPRKPRGCHGAGWSAGSKVQAQGT